MIRGARPCSHDIRSQHQVTPCKLRVCTQRFTKIRNWQTNETMSIVQVSLYAERQLPFMDSVFPRLRKRGICGINATTDRRRFRSIFKPLRRWRRTKVYPRWNMHFGRLEAGWKFASSIWIAPTMFDVTCFFACSPIMSNGIGSANSHCYCSRTSTVKAPALNVPHQLPNQSTRTAPNKKSTPK